MARHVVKKLSHPYDHRPVGLDPAQPLRKRWRYVPDGAGASSRRHVESALVCLPLLDTIVTLILHFVSILNSLHFQLQLRRPNPSLRSPRLSLLRRLVRLAWPRRREPLPLNASCRHAAALSQPLPTGPPKSVFLAWRDRLFRRVPSVPKS